MTINIELSGQACGAIITGVDLTAPLSSDDVADIRAAWLQHQVIVFPEQAMSDDDLERFSLYFGQFGDDPFLSSIENSQHIAAIERSANETSPIFAESWHTDWSFQASPPTGTCLFGITIPPIGGDTYFNNQQLALEKMPAQLRAKIEDKLAIHSAKGAYAPDGLYGEADKDNDRTMKILTSEEALKTHKHPLITTHPETGKERLYGSIGYIIGIEGMSHEEGIELMLEIHSWQTRVEFHYRHKWQENMLVMWDNRSVLHRASGGFDGYSRLLHRTTIGGMPTAAANP